MHGLNETLFFLINNGLHSQWNDLWLGNATWLGNGWVAFPIAILLVWFWSGEERKRNLLLLVSSAILGGILVALAKAAIDMPRPLAVYSDAVRVGSRHINVMFESLYAHSFPSGHTQTAFTIAAVLQRVRRSRYVTAIAFTIAAIVGISRVYVGAHFPIDVLAGAVIGLCSVWIAALAVDRFFKTKKSLANTLSIPAATSEANALVRDHSNAAITSAEVI